MTDFVLPQKPKRLKQKPTPPRKTPFAVIPTRAITDKNLTDRHRVVLALFSSFASRAGITWVSQKRLAQELGCSRQYINKVVKNLRLSGYVEKVGNSQCGKAGIAGPTWRVIFDPRLSAEDQIAIAGDGQDHELPDTDPVLQEEQMSNFRYNEPRPLGDILKEIKMPRGKRKMGTEQLHEATEERRVGKAEDYSREFSQAVRQACGVERLPNEQDARIASEFAAAGVPLDKFKAMLLESLVWHRESGKQPPAGLGYYRSAALSLVNG